MTDIGVGDWVECVDCVEGDHGFKIGGIYCVSEIERDNECDVCGICAGLKLAGMKTARDVGHDFDYWSACAFRPIYHPKHNWADKFAHVRFDGSLVDEGVTMTPNVARYSGFTISQPFLSEYELARFRLNFPGF